MGFAIVILMLGLMTTGTVAMSADYWFRPHRRRASRALKLIRQAQRLSLSTEMAIRKADRELRTASKKHVQAKLELALAGASVQTLKEYSKGIRAQVLNDAGIQTLLDLYKIPTENLVHVRGIGPASAQAIALGLEEAIRDIRTNRINYFPQLPLVDPSSERLIRATHDSLESRRSMEPHLKGLQAELNQRTSDTAKAEFAAKPWGWLNEFRRNSKEEAFDALARLEICRDDLRQQCAWAEEAALDFKRKTSRVSTAANLEEHYAVNAAHYSSYLAAVLPGHPKLIHPPRQKPNASGGFEKVENPVSLFGYESEVSTKRSQWDIQRLKSSGIHKNPLKPALVRTDLRFAREPGSSGGLPEEIVRVVESFALDGTMIAPGVTLRGYQAFGAKYLLQRKRSILGDEMGLGKTIQALAMIAHLHAQGRRHAVVLAPAGTIENWIREVANFTTLPAFSPRIPEIPESQWQETGGVLICSVDGFGRANGSRYIDRCDVAVIDEAHYIKNPGAARSKEATILLEKAEHVVLMSGTPMENRIEEFIELVSLAQPQIARSIRKRANPSDGNFGSLVAPAYLRRNQDDVLHELPERIEVEEWVDFCDTEQKAYRALITEANGSRNWMLARRASSTPLGSESSKMRRISELLAHYESTGEKVVIFSYFLDSLSALSDRFTCIGKIDGSMSSRKRLAMIEALREHRGHAVLLSQIQSGGIGLNIQAANVVIILEPQLKPSTEHQAIARLHRMGQLRRVVVHRMLAKNQIEVSLRNRLLVKQQDFDRTVRDSDVKDLSVDATDTAFLSGLIAEEMNRISR